MSNVIPTSGHGAIHVPAVGRQPLAVRFLLAAGLVGPLLFFIVVLVEGATRPGYNAWHHPVSTLALGPEGWVLTTALLVLGALLFCFAAGLRRVLNPGRGSTWGPILLAVTGLALIGEAIFATDPTLGYPPGAATTSTLHGGLHLLLSVVFEIPPVVAACIVLARRFAQAPGGRPWVLYSIATIILVIVFEVLGDLAFLSNDPGSLFGFFQRLEFFTAQGWIALLAGRLLTGPAQAALAAAAAGRAGASCRHRPADGLVELRLGDGRRAGVVPAPLGEAIHPASPAPGTPATPVPANGYGSAPGPHRAGRSADEDRAHGG